MAEVCVRVRVTGRVQGVWFRAWTKREAEGLGLRGWVRNAADEAVEALLAGPEAVVARMVEALHRGPEMARVDAVETERVEDRVGEGFEIVR